MNIIYDNLWLCDDCANVAVNDDYTGIASDERIEEVDHGLSLLYQQGYLSADYDEYEGVDEFTWKPCDCCRTHLGGARHRFALLGN
jgi:hypothetical protein